MTDIEKRFSPAASLSLTIEDLCAGATALDAIRAKVLEVAQLVEKTCPPCRETSLAVTKLEEAVMWAGRGILLRGAAPKVADNG